MRLRAQQRNGITIGVKIGDGGQGAVYTLEGNPALVFKQYLTPIPGGAARFEDLVGRRPAVEAAFRGEKIAMAWPEQLVLHGDELDGYVMTRIGMEYSVTLRGDLYPAAFSYVFPRPGPFAHDPVPTQHQRRELGRLVAIFMDALHRNDLTYGDMSWSNMLFTLTPKPGVFVLDVDGMRPVGQPTFSGGRVAQTPDWFDPNSPDHEHENGSFDLDRYKLALLIYRLLVAHSLDASLPTDPDSFGEIADMTPLSQKRIGRLLRRAAGPAGTRPTASEWARALADDGGAQ